MITATLADMRKSVDFFNTQEVINIINGRKKENIGYFVPQQLKTDFLKFVNSLEQDKKIKQAKKAAQAQALDPIGDHSVGDNLA
jgi:hypothetical protein